MRKNWTALVDLSLRCMLAACTLAPVPASAEPSAGSSAAAPKPLKWTLWPLPGVIDTRDGKPTDGIAMDLLRRLMVQLPQFEPRYQLTNSLRQQSDMQRRDNFCSALLFQRPESDKYGYFVPIMASTPIQVVIRRGAESQFPIVNGALSLAQLAGRDGLRGGYSGFRTYPPLIRTWIADAQRDGRMEKATGTPSGENLLRMVSLGRIDFTFELATLTKVVNQRLRSGGELVGLPIAGHRDLIEAGVYCPRTVWGRRVASELDRAMRELALEPSALLALYRPWTPEDILQAYEEDLRMYYKARALRAVELD